MQRFAFTSISSREALTVAKFSFTPLRRYYSRSATCIRPATLDYAVNSGNGLNLANQYKQHQNVIHTSGAQWRLQLFTPSVIIWSLLFAWCVSLHVNRDANQRQ